MSDAPAAAGGGAPRLPDVPLALDDRLVIATPEGLDVELVVAGLGSRAAAALLDGLVIGAGLLAAWLLFLLVATVSVGLAQGLIFLAMFLAFFGYYPVLEGFWSGRTVGKRAVGLRVLTVDGNRAAFWRIVVRNVLRFVDYLPSAYLVGMVSVLATRRNQRLGDLVAGTVVVRERVAADPASALRSGAAVGASPSVWANQAPVAAAALPPEVASWDLSAVRPDEVQAVRAFLDRRWSLPPDVRYRLAYDFAMRLRPKVVGPPEHDGPERFLEWIAYVKQVRG